MFFLEGQEAGGMGFVKNRPRTFIVPFNDAFCIYVYTLAGFLLFRLGICLFKCLR